MTTARGRPATESPVNGEANGGRVRTARSTNIAAATLIAVCLSASASADTELRWEQWGENAVGGSASEGTHAWVTHGLYQRGREIGLTRGESAGLALTIMAVWEVYEVQAVDAQGVSVQDIVANAAGVAAGVAGLGLRYSYATCRDPDDSGEHPWLDIPVLPRNDLTYAIEFERDSWTLGYKYLGRPGDLVVGTTTMPVLTGEHGRQKVIAHVGREWENGWHCAVGYDGHGGVTMGGGYRVALWGLGIDITTVAGPDTMGMGLSGFISYDSLF